MTIIQLLNQPMPPGSYWGSLIFALQDEFDICETVVKVQRLMLRLEGDGPVPQISDMHRLFKKKFMG